MKMHYNNALNPKLYKIPICGIKADENTKCTENKDRVTCKRCLKRLSGQ